MGATRSALPYAEDSFDAATVGFGARNFDDLSRGLAEMARVVRPGGRVVVLEITTPDAAAAVAVLPAVVRPDRPRARAAGGRRLGVVARLRDGPADSAIADAYNYLPNSVKRFPAPAALAAEMQRAGLSTSPT